MATEIKFHIADNYDHAETVQNRICCMILNEDETGMISCEGTPMKFYIIIKTSNPLRVIVDLIEDGFDI